MYILHVPLMIYKGGKLSNPTFYRILEPVHRVPRINDLVIGIAVYRGTFYPLCIGKGILPTYGLVISTKFIEEFPRRIRFP